jgi:hypothetical protein
MMEAEFEPEGYNYEDYGYYGDYKDYGYYGDYEDCGDYEDYDKEVMEDMDNVYNNYKYRL